MKPELDEGQQTVLLKAFSNKDKSISTQDAPISTLAKLRREGLVWRQGRFWHWQPVWYGLTSKGKALAKELRKDQKNADARDGTRTF